MLARVEPVACQAREVDSTDERDLVVHHDELLVVAMERALLCVESHRDARPTDELVARPPHLAAVGMEERQRRARPGQHAHVDALGGVRKQLAQRRPSVFEPERRIEVPPCEVDVRACRVDGLRDPGQRLLAVCEQLYATGLARRKGRRIRPTPRLGIDRADPATTAEATDMVGADRALDELADEGVQPVERVRGHGALLPHGAETLTPS